MGDDIHNTNTTAEDLAIERAEQQLADPSAANMQFLQSTIVNNEFDGLGASTGFFNASAKQSIASPTHSGSGFSGLSPAYSGAGLLGAVAVADMGGVSSAMGIAAQVASAAPVTFGKEAVGESATLAALGDKALAQQTADSNSALLKPLANADGSMVPLSPEFSQLLAMLEGSDSVNPDDALMSLVGGLGQNPSSENLQGAIDAVLGQINLLNSTFEPVFDGLAGEVQSQVGVQNSLSSTDLGFSILDSADDVSTTLSDLLGSVDVVSNPQIDSLLSLGSTLDDVVSLVGSLPELDIVDGVLDPITDVIEPVIDPIVEIITDITDPIADPVIDVIEPVIDPIVDIITDITDPIADPVIDVIEPVIDPILGPITDGGLLSGLSSTSSDSDTGLLDSLSSGISSSAGSEGGVLDGALSPLDSNK
ncbi:MAG: hypothetical protein KJ798_10065 [Gammaproteobacteria bacterium]|nr:hypothetical protein [Gammaproteobacteria bacterium]MBU0850706.1 hypothetical protein [Gammaproteobacteria bacterium]MBU1780718.1 hypothetical protein [Gammaproteobacteria bacterium]MBU2086460.1 hypothetical protein [Gammaproteobacteria bacterium]MBU2127853.1 hypothetical protein [Gammaproteobacteria bacterium]